MPSFSDADTVSSSESGTRAMPGSFTQIPSPKAWSNGDDLYAGTLNKEWRDTFNWLLRNTSPGFSGYNGSGASLTFTSNVAIPILSEELKRGNITHATNDTKVYVWEPGWYLGFCQVGANLSSVTGGATTLSSVVKVNGLVASTNDQSRSSANQWNLEHSFSLYLNAGDYVEIAIAGTWTGTMTGFTQSYSFPFLGLWWRDKNAAT